MSEGSLSPIIVKYEKLLDEDPRSRSFAPLAEAYRQVGLLDKAFDVLKKGLRYNPEYLLGYLTLALCYFDKKEYGLAYSTLKPLIAHNRDNLKLQRVFADCAKKTNNLEEALDSYKYLLFLNPKDKEIAQQVTVLEEELHEEAVYAKEEAANFDLQELTPNPEDDKEIDNWVQYDLAKNQEEERDDLEQWTVGKKQEEESIALSFDREETQDDHLEEGPLLIYDGEELDEDEEDEVEDYKGNILELGRKTAEEAGEEIAPVITHTLVDIYMKQGHFQKAKEILEKIIEIGPKSDSALEKLAKIEECLGAQDQEADITDTEGRENLMAAFDKSVGTSLFDDDGIAEEETHDYSELIDELDLVLSDYLSEIKGKHRNHTP